VLADSFTLKDLKLAVINEDLKKLEELSKKIPSYSSIDEAKEILVYIELANNIIKKKKKELLKDIQQLKKIKNYGF